MGEEREGVKKDGGRETRTWDYVGHPQTDLCEQERSFIDMQFLHGSMHCTLSNSIYSAYHQVYIMHMRTLQHFYKERGTPLFVFTSVILYVYNTHCHNVL